MGLHSETRASVEQRREARAEAGREALGEVDPDSVRRHAGHLRTDKYAPGDKVWVKYTNGRRIETIVEINPATGKVAIASRHNKSGKRWLPATVVGEVVEVRDGVPIL